MKYFGIIWKNLMRNKRRTILTALSIAFSLFLVSFLRTLTLEFSRTNLSPMSVRRAVVRRSTSLAELLPEFYKRKIAGIPEVEMLVGRNWVGGIYKEPKNFFANFAIEHENFFQAYPEIQLEEGAKQAFLTQRSAALCGVKLAKRFGWKVGDRITLLGSIYPVDLEFTLVGFYTSDVEETTFFFRRDYFEEALGKPGKVGVYTIVARSAEAIPKIIDAVDGMFRNTEAETLTETERAFQAGFASMVGNVQGLVISVGSVIVFMILLVVGNTMSMSIRERSHEIAILKSLGYQNESLIGMLLGESVAISFVGGLLGCLCARLVFSMVDIPNFTFGFIRRFKVEPSTIALGLAIALAVGLISGGLPALHVARLRVADGLRRVA